MISSCSQICFQELTVEISELKRQRDGLEAELKKVFLLSPSLSYLKPKKKIHLTGDTFLSYLILITHVILSFLICSNT